MDEYAFWRRLVAELVGTALLVYIGVGSIPALILAQGDEAFNAATLGFIALAFGAIVMIVVYIFGFVSGSHINPAVTVGLAAGGKFPWKQVPGYIVAQVIGAVIGAFAIIASLGMFASEAGLGIASSGGIPMWQSFAAEFIGTFILVLVVFGAIHRKAPPSMAGVSIGFAVFAIIIVIGSTTGGSINPARNTGPMIVQALLGGEVNWAEWPVYVVAELLAGIVAALVFGAMTRTRADVDTN
ncbi:MIP/aquaporin family protein [Gulosibacter molinativorax]|uniref:Aquaporin family protein n=1 Tax=Gulosibacter molinativorax TaxID=256821 RepID=A0ABT7C9I0_9MICO|nr:MIP/aquaporin family protein [Gulosibacter molinativorax]MDJ1371871.1 aquaporin family protein [Gulosibacter molinativorax]QUY62520.1 Aquaporin AqpM [Gulosibacter molinativorax]